MTVRYGLGFLKADDGSVFKSSSFLLSRDHMAPNGGFSSTRGPKGPLSI